jgi:hypothetical protein
MYPSAYLHEAYCSLIVSHAICVQSIHTLLTFNQYRLHTYDYIITNTPSSSSIFFSYYHVHKQFIVKNVLADSIYQVVLFWNNLFSLLVLHQHFYINVDVVLWDHWLVYVVVVEIYFFVFHDHHIKNRWIDVKYL